ncbi:MAG: lysylphosphatidylglycerol synthase transmembrane domain-containing protein [Desulfobacteraceae bacterium]|nr:lysylphosphatidylglycerol synthase transmembrane domain-containing protein [Desulfobacteraceae bacterium]
MHKKIALSLIIGILASAGMLYLALRNVPMADLAAYIVEINYAWIFPSMALIILAFVLRVVRWQLILKSELQLGFWKAFHPLMIGFMINCILPGRVGELARPAILKKENSLAVTTGLATVAMERIFDIVMLIILFAIFFSKMTSRPDLEINFMGYSLTTQKLQSAAWAMIRLSLVLLVGLGLFAFTTTRRWMMGILAGGTALISKAGARPQRFADKALHLINGVAERFADGLSLVRNPKRALTCSILTVLIWTISALSYYVFTFGCPGVELSFVEMTTFMVVVCFFIALPSAPGFWGVWEAGGVFALTLFGVTTKEAAGFTLINHVINLFPIIIIGLISALITSVNIVQLSYGAQNSAEPQRNIASEPS